MKKISSSYRTTTGIPYSRTVVGDIAESGKKNVWLIKQENAQVTKLTDQEKISQMIMLYWD